MTSSIHSLFTLWWTDGGRDDWRTGQVAELVGRAGNQLIRSPVHCIALQQLIKTLFELM